MTVILCMQCGEVLSTDCACESDEGDSDDHVVGLQLLR